MSFSRPREPAALDRRVRPSSLNRYWALRPRRRATAENEDGTECERSIGRLFQPSDVFLDRRPDGEELRS
jgi:hypothetical protein